MKKVYATAAFAAALPFVVFAVTPAKATLAAAPPKAESAQNGPSATTTGGRAS